MKSNILLSSLLALGLACAATAPAAALMTPDKINISTHFNVTRLAWYGLNWIDETGYFTDAGIEVSFRYLQDSTRAVQHPWKTLMKTRSIAA